MTASTNNLIMGPQSSSNTNTSGSKPQLQNSSSSSLLQHQAVSVVQTPNYLILCGLWCGIVNNASFCVLLGASQDIAAHFDMVDSVSLLTSGSTTGSILGVALNARLCVGTFTEFVRIILLLLGATAGYLMIIFAYRIFGPGEGGFYLCILGAFLLGYCQSAGEATNLGIARKFDAKMLSSWGAGTGLSGVLGPFIYILLTASWGLDAGQVCWVLIGCLPFYLMAFWVIVNESEKGANEANLTDSSTHQNNGSLPLLDAQDGPGNSSGGPVGTSSSQQNVAVPPQMAISSEERTLTTSGNSGANTSSSNNMIVQRGISSSSIGVPHRTSSSQQVESESVALSFDNFLIVVNYCKSVMINMVLVYALEYLITSGFMERTTLCPNNPDSELSVKAYTIFWCLYNVGVTLSRLSVAFFQIKQVWILTILQAINVLFWAVYASTQIVHHVNGNLWIYYLLGLHMVWVGFMGGAVYSNCMWLFNTLPQIPDKYRELGINLGFFFSNVGIVLATFFATFLDNSFLEDKKLFPPRGDCPEKGAEKHHVGPKGFSYYGRGGALVDSGSTVVHGANVMNQNQNDNYNHYPVNLNINLESVIQNTFMSILPSSLSGGGIGGGTSEGKFI